MIHAENLSKRYAEKIAVYDLSFTVEQGTVLGFIGPNGAGKTTTMRMLCGVMPPSSGSVVIDSINMLEEPVKAKALVGYLPENAPLYSNMSVMAFLEYCGMMRNIPSKKLRDAVYTAMERCSLESVKNDELESLSKGYRRRVCLAQAIIHNPRALVLDEPTDGLDPNQKQEIRKLIDSIRRDSAIIVSTHILEEVDALCDNVLAICRGKKVFNGSTAEFRRLSPDAEALELSLVIDCPQSDAVTMFEKLPETGKIAASSFNPASSELLIKIKPADGVRPEQLLGAASRLAHDKNWITTECRILEGRLTDVFSMLSAGSEEVHVGGTE